MKKIFLILSIGFFLAANAQETVLPAKPHKGVTYIKNLNITETAKSFPASSLMYSQTDCKMKMNMRITNTLKNVFK